MTTRKKLRSDIALIEPDKITVHGFDLIRDLVGKISLGDMAFLQLKKRLPTPPESVVFNAITVTLVEHGLTPSAISARMTYAGAPDAMQVAIAAGLCGMGSVMAGGMENTARILQEALPDPQAHADIDALALGVVKGHARSQSIPGIGHRFHTSDDPRATRLFQIARANGFDGPYMALMQSISTHAASTYGKLLPINMLGAIGAIASELGLPWQIVRGIGVIGRAIGLVGHVLEEMQDPLSREIQTRAQEEATAHLRGD